MTWQLFEIILSLLNESKRSTKYSIQFKILPSQIKIPNKDFQATGSKQP